MQLHGATGKGNDQVRFELGAMLLVLCESHCAVARNGTSHLEIDFSNIVRSTTSLLKKREERNHLIPWMQICYTFLMRGMYLKILRMNQRRICGNGRFLRKECS